jgi:antirestriction protein
MEKVMGNSLKTNHQPRIYVACLAAYNSGYLHGAWIDAAQEPWRIYDDVKSMLAASPITGAEEWAIHDYEGFGGVCIEEYAGFDHVSALASFVAEHGEVGAALLDHFSGDLDEAQQAITDRYMGEHSSLADCVQELTEESTTIPQRLRYYIDFKAMARDAELNGELFGVTTAHDVVHVFAGC